MRNIGDQVLPMTSKAAIIQQVAVPVHINYGSPQKPRMIGKNFKEDQQQSFPDNRTIQTTSY